MPIPDTWYAKAGESSIAYQVFGSGPHRVVAVPGVVSNVELFWEFPRNHHWFERWGSFATVVQFDKRGTGCSDRITGAASVEERMEDFHVVMDAVGWDRATVWGLSEGGSLACLFAATYPERTERLGLHGSFARLLWAPDYEIGIAPEVYDSICREWAAHWGTPETLSLPLFGHCQVGDEAYLQWLTHFERLSSTPANVLAMMALNAQIDIRHVLPVIGVPTLVVHARQDHAISVEHGRYLAAHIPGARLFEYDGEHFPAQVGVDEVLDAVEEFVTGRQPVVEPGRVLATVLFTDIVDSTRQAADVGDRRWRELLDRHDTLVDRALERHPGRKVNPTGDGMLAVFDGPARAVRCGLAIRDGVAALGLQMRAGAHTGEVELRGDDISGVAVNIGARVAALAGPSELLVSRTVTDLVAGSGIDFEDRGDHELKGVPGTWRLFSVTG
jgi:class 3 adenylate cyclase/alpha-beta hydrolase superfamily lysophospholipase